MSIEGIKKEQARHGDRVPAVSSNDLAARALDGAPHALLVVDSNGVIRALSAAAATLLLRDPADLVGSPIDRLLTIDGGGLDLFLGGDPDALAAGAAVFCRWCGVTARR